MFRPADCHAALVSELNNSLKDLSFSFKNGKFKRHPFSGNPLGTDDHISPSRKWNPAGRFPIQREAVLAQKFIGGILKDGLKLLRQPL